MNTYTHLLPKAVIKYHYLTYLLLRKQMVLRYRMSIGGFIWTLLNPLFSMIVLVGVFSTIFGQDIKTFAVFIFSGIIPWNFFSSSMGQSTSVLIDNEQLIKKIYIPKIIYIISLLLGMLLDAIIVFICFYSLLLFIGSGLSFSLLSLIPAYLALFFFIFGLSLILSVFTVYVRDLTHIVPVALQAGFFLSPVLFDQSRIDHPILTFIFNINPLSYYIDLFRSPILYGNISYLNTWIICIFLSTVSMVIGLLIFNKFNKKIIFRLN